MEKTLTPPEDAEVKAEKEPATSKKDYDDYIIYAVLIFTVIVVSFAGYSVFKLYFPSAMQAISAAPTGMAVASTMPLTGFDKQLAREMMDKNNDGKCDSCGMPVEMCIDSGQMQCNMDSKSTIGILGSQHIHADFKVYTNGKPVDFSDKTHMAQAQAGKSVSSFIHVDSGAPAPEKTGDVLHMHATGVPLWIFFKSIGVELPTGAKAYANGAVIGDWQNYVFTDMDKILVTDGAGDLNGQMNSVTGFAARH